jgi:head-tail adaptor
MAKTAGKLSDRFAFDRRTTASDGAGNFQDAWVQSHGPVATELIYMKGGESVIASRLQGNKPVVLVIRDCASARLITTDWRARDVRGSAIYNIRDIIPSQRRGHIDILCESGVAHG